MWINLLDELPTKNKEVIFLLTRPLYDRDLKPILTEFFFYSERYTDTIRLENSDLAENVIQDIKRYGCIRWKYI